MKQEKKKHIYYGTEKSECLFLTLSGGKNIAFRSPRCKENRIQICAQKPYSSFGCNEKLISWVFGV